MLKADKDCGSEIGRQDLWPKFIKQTNSQASLTPAADAERVYFYFSTMGLLSVDACTSQELCRQEIPTPFFVFKWGPGISPVLYRDMGLFCQDDDLLSTMYSFYKATGEKLGGKRSGSTWLSTILTRLSVPQQDVMPSSWQRPAC